MTNDSSGMIPEFEPRHRLRLAIEASGIGVQGLADAMGVSRGTVGNWLGGTTHPKPYALRQIAEITRINAGWLLTGVPSVEPQQPTLRSVKGGKCAPSDSNREPAGNDIITLRTLQEAA